MSNCSSNERALKRCNMSGYICRGIDPAQDLEDFSNVWLARNFQVKFMYKNML